MEKAASSSSYEAPTFLQLPDNLIGSMVDSASILGDHSWDNDWVEQDLDEAIELQAERDNLVQQLHDKDHMDMEVFIVENQEA